MSFYEALWHGEAIADGADPEEALAGYVAVRPEDGDWPAACAAPGADPCLHRYASFDAFLDNDDALERIAVTASMIEAALPPGPGGLPQCAEDG